jgi:hypothetical protein
LNFAACADRGNKSGNVANPGSALQKSRRSMKVPPTEMGMN